MFLDAFAIAFEHGAADVFAFEGKTSGFDGEVGADGEADQIDGVGHGPGFVEVVDAPDQAAFDVAPGAEIFDVKIADGKDVRSLGQFGTDLGPELRPAVVSGAEEGEEFRLHVGVFEAEVFLIEVSALGEPGFELAGGFDDVHAGNDSDGGKGKSNLGCGLRASARASGLRAASSGRFEGAFTTEARRHGENLETRRKEKGSDFLVTLW